MKPKHIFIVRHGQSEGNVDKAVYSQKPDYALLLTDKGKDDAQKAGVLINKFIETSRKEESDDYDFFAQDDWIRDACMASYYSSYFRARQTAEIALENIDMGIYFNREEPRLREQEWAGNLPKEGYSQDMEDDREDFGHFYYRFRDGESCADVYDRVSDFLSTLYRDFEKPDFPTNVCVFGHGMTNRVFLMRLLKLTVEEFESIKNPKNGEVWILRLTDDQKYELVTPYEKFEVRHKWKYPKKINENSI